ncbi:hypothetical protein ABW21_db0201348 [Orbilia brochopaga]|nr:hypothetical protein ABW21_db0201348 [Drechslerella brochopaga]
MVQDGALENDFSASKENIPKVVEETVLESAKHAPSISRTQREFVAATGLRSGGYGGRLLTQGKRRQQSGIISLDQSDNDDQDLSVFDPVNSTESAPDRSINVRPDRDVNQSVRLVRTNDTSNPDIINKRKGGITQSQQAIQGGKQSSRGQRTFRPENATSVISDTDELSEEDRASDIGDTEYMRPTNNRSAPFKTLGLAQADASNTESRGTIAYSAVEKTALTSHSQKRAGRPKKGQRSSHMKASKIASREQMAAGSLNQVPHQDDPSTSKEAADARPSQGAQPTSDQPSLKRGRKRKAGSLTEERQSINAPSHSKTAIRGDHASKKLDKPGDQNPPGDLLSNSATVESERPKRSRIAPLQFWKNEKRVYKVNGRRESGTAISLTEEVIRADEAPVSRPLRKPRARTQESTARFKKAGKRGKRRVADRNEQEGIGDNDTDDDDGDSDDGDDDEDWEKVGKLVGMVKQWPFDLSGGDEDEIEDEIAISRNGIEFKPIFGSDYLFAKTMGKEFMGCGILELQTGATKKLKSSGKMQLVFFVLEGKIEAEVNELGFRITKGGQFQVPRGNMYKISNPFPRTARIFFAQACIPEPELE